MDQPKRFPVGQQIGRPGPETASPMNPFVAQMMGALMGGANGGLAMNPDTLKGAPVWVSELFNALQNIETQLEVLKYALMRRGLLTNNEFQEAMMMVTRAAEEQYAKQVSQIGQQLPPAMSQDPRRPPQP